MRTAFIVAASSDIGGALARRWLGYGWRVGGTYRTRSAAVEELERLGARLVACDVADPAAVSQAAEGLRSFGRWDIVVLCPGTLEPIGPFAEGRFDAWAASLDANLVGQLRMVHALLPGRRPSALGPCVVWFAGGGTNGAPVNYSAYTLSKIALIKMCELLDAEIPDTRFTILGPGVVQTKIHRETLKAGARAAATYQRAMDALAGKGCVPMDQVLACCDWVVDAPREVVSGRNFSVEFDAWATEELEQVLWQDPSMYKLRRHGNDRLVRQETLVRHESG